MWRGALRDKFFCPGGRFYRSPLGGFGKDPGEIAVRIKSVFLRGLDQAEQDRTASCPTGGVGKQEILPGDHKGLDAPFRPVITEFNAAILQVRVQFSPLFFG